MTSAALFCRLVSPHTGQSSSVWLQLTLFDEWTVCHDVADGRGKLRTVLRTYKTYGEAETAAILLRDSMLQSGYSFGSPDDRLYQTSNVVRLDFSRQSRLDTRSIAGLPLFCAQESVVGLKDVHSVPKSAFLPLRLVFACNSPEYFLSLPVAWALKDTEEMFWIGVGLEQIGVTNVLDLATLASDKLLAVPNISEKILIDIDKKLKSIGLGLCVKRLIFPKMLQGK